MGLFSKKSKNDDDSAMENASKSSGSKSGGRKGFFSKKPKSPKVVEEPIEEEVEEARAEAPFAVSTSDDDDDHSSADSGRLDDEEENANRELFEQQQDFVDEQQKHFKVSDVKTTHEQNYQAVSENRPSARQAAFQGGMRYDWIDVETIAALKVQAAYRGLATRNEMIRQGKTTAAMRNREREINARHHSDPDRIASEDVPFLVRWCGVGLLFGEAEEGLTDYDRRQREKEQAKNQRKADELEREAKLRGQFGKRSKQTRETVEVREGR